MYHLLPFRFNIFNGNELLTNDLGDYIIVPRGTVQRIVERDISPSEELYKDLSASFFISESPIPELTSLPCIFSSLRSGVIKIAYTARLPVRKVARKNTT